MSLVIASNEIQSNTTIGSSFQAPFSWSNHLNQPLLVKAGSEIAVSSLKINKDGTITLSPSNRFYIYWGQKLSSTVAIEDTNSAVHITDLGLTSPTDFTVETLATRLTDALNKALPTPETYGMASCTVVRNAEGTDFQGFNFIFTTRDKITTSTIPQTWVNVWSEDIPTAGLTFNPATSVLTPKLTYIQGGGMTGLSRYNIATATDTPLSLNGGVYQVSLKNAGSTAWAVGLRRCMGIEYKSTPEIYDPSQSQYDYSEQYADYTVCAVQDSIGTAGNNFKIRVFCSAPDTSILDQTDSFLTQKEVQYYNASASTDFTAVYNWSTNASAIDSVKFEVKNEEIKVIVSASAVDYTLVNITSDYKLVDGSGLTVPIRYPPVRDTCRNLYPTAFIANNASNNRSLTVQKWTGRTISGFTYAHPSNDWWGRLSSYDLMEEEAYPLETRPPLDTSSAQSPLVQPTYGSVSGSDVLTGQEFIMVLRPNASYTDTSYANADTLLGFNGVSVLENASKSGSNSEISKYTSEQAPTLKSTTSLFVRINNLPVKSYNAGQSRRSQIIYSAPRFSSGTDQSVGALFFEAPEKTFISLDNETSDIQLNQIDIDIVNEDETLADDLLGKTVCTLHIREKRK
tara:strand:+ start:5098 stop:6978 length:1881 start_codon:yes stop_codon:yes gene_type:complete